MTIGELKLLLNEYEDHLNIRQHDSEYGAVAIKAVGRPESGNNEPGNYIVIYPYNLILQP